MTTYKPHFACFDCRKTFKRKLLVDINKDKAYDKNHLGKESKCPDCGELMANMGLDFEAPKKTNVKAWKHLSSLYETGITFHSCGCGGPGYVPRDQQELIDHFTEIKKGYVEHRRFWSNRKISSKKQSQQKKQLDWKENGKFICRIPSKMKIGTRKNKSIDIADAIQYWLDKIKEIDGYIASVQ